MAKLEISLLAGHESKEFLAKLTAQLDRLEALSDKLPAGDADEDEETEEDEDDEEEAPKLKSKKKAKTFDDDEEAEEEADVDDADDEEEDEEVEDADEESEEEDDEDEDEKPKKGHKAKAKPVAKKGKVKKVTIDDCNDAAKALCLAWGGKAGRPKVLKFMKKNFKVESVQDLDAKQYAKFVEVFNAEAEA